MLKAGFIGFGRMGITHFSILNSHPKVNIKAICDKSSTMMSIVKKYLDVETYSDYKKMLDNVELDFVVISTPSDSHTEVINAAIDRDIHVFVEKPFSLDSEQGRNTLTLLEPKRLVNQVGYVNRFNEVFVAVKDLLREGAIGEVKSFRSEMHGATVLKDSKGGWRGKHKSGGGCMYEFASHCIDLSIFMFGKPHAISGSVLQSIYSTAVEDIVSATFDYGPRLKGDIFVNWSDPSFRKPANILTILGTRGKIVADKHAYKIFLTEADPRHGFDKGWNTRYITDFARSVRFYVRGNEFTTQLDYFIDCIENKQFENVASFAESLLTDQVIEEIIHDATLPRTHHRPQAEHDTGWIEKQQPSVWKKLFGRG